MQRPVSMQPSKSWQIPVQPTPAQLYGNNNIHPFSKQNVQPGHETYNTEYISGMDRQPLLQAETSDLNSETKVDLQPSELRAFVLQVLGWGTTFETLYYYNFVTAGVHALNALMVALLSMNIEPDGVRIEEGPTRNFTHVTGPYIAATCTVNNTGILIDGTYMDLKGPDTLFFVQPEQEFDLKTYFAILIVIFFSLSAVFQAAQGFSKEAYRRRVETNDVNVLRYIEYSLSASVMMVAIANGIMIFDIYTHILVFTCTMLCMMLGLVADYIRMAERTIHEQLLTSAIWMNYTQGLNSLMWRVHYLGWIAMLSPYFFVFGVAYYRVSMDLSQCSQNSNASQQGPPDYVPVILFGQLGLFSAFGVVQTLQFMSYPYTYENGNKYKKIKLLPPGAELQQHYVPNEQAAGSLQQYGYYEGMKDIGIAAEHRFISLSVFAKTLLGWIIVANIIFR